LFLCANAGQAAPAKPEKPKPAKLSIRGYGLLGNRELRRILRTVELGGKKPEFFTAEFVEDASLILASRVRRDGYLRPSISAELTLASGGKIEVQTETLLDNPLPHPLALRAVRFRIRRGTLYYFKSLQFEGLEGITERQARKYFIETDDLLHLRTSRIYTPERLRRGVSSLSEVLNQLGYAEVRIDEPRLQMNDTNGQVSVMIRVHPGAKFIVHSVRQEYLPGYNRGTQDVRDPGHTRPN
jgi:outer membrane protein assembly factor BamA